MTFVWPALLWIVSADPAVETKFVQMHPRQEQAGTAVRSRGQTRALLTVHGIRFNPFTAKLYDKPEFHKWQTPEGEFLRAVGDSADVYSFSYAQTGTAEQVANCAGLREAVATLKALKYEEIVLIGHSCGGLLVRLFVEDNPDAGVTRVLSVAAPNLGGGLGGIGISLKKAGDPLVESLGQKERADCLRRRAEKKIPENVQFVSIIGDSGGLGFGDFVVPVESQWSPCLRKQGIPAVKTSATHFGMRSKSGCAQLAQLIRSDHPRWSAAKVAALERELSENALRLPIIPLEFDFSK